MFVLGGNLLEEVKVLDGGRRIEYDMPIESIHDNKKVGVTIDRYRNMTEDYLLFNATVYLVDGNTVRYLDEFSKKVVFTMTNTKITSLENLPMNLAMIVYNTIESCIKRIVRDDNLISSLRILQSFVIEKMKREKRKFEVTKVSDSSISIEVSENEKLFLSTNRVGYNIEYVSLHKYGDGIRQIGNRSIHPLSSDFDRCDLTESMHICNFLRSNKVSVKTSFHISNDEATELLDSFIDYILQPVNL